MPDFATYGATLWSGAMQAAATIVARYETPGRHDPDETAHRVLDLAARLIRNLPEYDGRVAASVASSIRQRS